LTKDVVAYPGEIMWDTSKPDGTPRKLLDVSKIRNIGWQFKIDLSKGLSHTYRWYLEQ